MHGGPAGTGRAGRRIRHVHGQRRRYACQAIVDVASKSLSGVSWTGGPGVGVGVATTGL